MDNKITIKGKLVHKPRVRPLCECGRPACIDSPYCQLCGWEYTITQKQLDRVSEIAQSQIFLYIGENSKIIMAALGFSWNEETKRFEEAE